MPVNIGSTNIGRIYLGSTEIAEVYLGSTKIFGSAVDPYNPLGLPQYTIRARFASAPAATANGGFSGSITHVSGDIYDIQTSNWVRLFGASLLSVAQIDQKPVEVLGANSTGITSMDYTFYACSSLTSIPLMDTSSVTSVDSMFYNDTSLTSVPLFNTSNVTNFYAMIYGCTALTSVPALNLSSAVDVTYMFMNCTGVSSGMLSLYNSVSQQATPPTYHYNMFNNCGANTANGLLELKQIPGNWGGRYGEVTCEKYYYSSANADLAAYTPRAAAGFLAGAIWVPDRSYVNSVVYSIKTPAKAGTMRVYPTSRFYKWNSSATQSNEQAVKFGAFAIPKANLSRQSVYSNYYGWSSSSEPQFLYKIADATTAPTSSYKNYTPPANFKCVITTNYPSIIYPSLPADWAILLCLYIYTNNTYYFGTVARNNYGYLPYTSDGDLIVQVGDITPST